MAGGAGRGRGWVLAAIAAVVVLLTAVLGAATNIGTGILPGWGWLKDPVVMWSVVAGATALLMVLAALQHRLSGRTASAGAGTAIVSVWPRRPGRAQAGMGSLRPPELTDAGIRGRDLLVKQLAGRHRWRSRNRPRVHVLHGMGGAGKTTVAQLLAQRLFRAGVRVWWVSAATATQLQDGMRLLAADLGASDTDIHHAWSETGSGPDLVWRLLEQLPQRWLLVVDNADDTRLLAAAGEPMAAGRGWIRPVAHRHGTLIVTTRDADPGTWPSQQHGGTLEHDWYQLHPVGMLTPADGANVLLSHADTAGTADEATALAERLGGLPLALSLAGQSIGQARRTGIIGPRSTFTGYHAALETGQALPQQPAGHTPSEAQARRTIDRTWELSLDLLDSRGLPQARTLLRLLATFADAPIPSTVLDPHTLAASALLRGLTTEGLAVLLQALTGAGLLALDHTDPSAPVTLIRLHPLIRDTSRRYVNTTRHYADYLALAITLLSLTIVGAPEDPANWPTWQTLVPHTTDLLGQATTQPDTSDETLIDVCGLTQRTARYLGEAGLHQSARDLFAELLPIYERVQGVEHPEILATRHNLARWTGAAGDPAGACDLFAELLPIRERVQGVEHPDTLDTRNHHAYWIGKAGDPAGARDLLAELLPIYERIQGVEHPDTLATRHNFAHWIGVASDPAAARDLFAELLPIRERVLGVEHPDTVTTRYDHAYWIGVAGDPAGARDLLAELLPIRERVQGAEHPEILATRHNLARWTGAAGDPAGARDLLAELLPIRERVQGAEHPDTLDTRNHLAHWARRALR